MADEGVLPGIEKLLNKLMEEDASAAKELQPRFVHVNRQQLVMRTIDVEQLIEADHPARAIWEFWGE